MSDDVTIVEVGPRDGLQNEPGQVPTATKIALIERLADAGLPVVEATSFVSARWIPQLADADDVLSHFRRRRGVRYPVLIPNVLGLERALEVGADAVAVFTAASDAFSRKNTNCGIDESLARLRPAVAYAREAGLWVRGYVSCALGCPYQGGIAVREVVRVALALGAMGCDEICLGDTIGVGTPRQARTVLRACADELGMARMAVHFHDTRGQALTNFYACLDAGVRTVDAAVGGLGGCPYAAGASGNLATEDLVYMLDGLGVATGVDLNALLDTACWITQLLGRTPASRLARIAPDKRVLMPASPPLHRDHDRGVAA